MIVKTIEPILSENIYKKLPENKIIKIDDYIYKINKKQVATAKLTQRYLQQQQQPWQRVNVRLNQLNTTSNKLSLVENGIKIGKGIKKVLVSGQIAFWQGSNPPLNYFQADLLLNGEEISFNAIVNAQLLQISCILTPIIIDVKQGDLIQIASKYGDNVANFNILEKATYLTVEVVE